MQESTSPSPNQVLDSNTERHHITGIAQWRETLLWLFQQAEAENCQRIVCCSPAFGSWPLSDTAILEAMQNWLRPARSLILIGNEFDSIIRQHPRFVAWRQRWDTIVLGRKVSRQFQKDTPSFLSTGKHAVLLMNPDFLTGVAGRDASLVQQVNESADEWIHNRSVNGFPANTLGL